MKQSAAEVTPSRNWSRLLVLETIHLVHEPLGASPNRLHHPSISNFHHPVPITPELSDVDRLLLGNGGPIPRCSDDLEPLGSEQDGCFVGTLVVPIADDHVSRDQVDCAKGIVDTTFP